MIKFAISGKQRKALKRELSSLKHFVKNFWYYHGLEKDMADIYGSSESLILDENAQRVYDEAIQKIVEIENRLSATCSKLQSEHCNYVYLSID